MGQERWNTYRGNPPLSVTHPELAAQLIDQELAGRLTAGSDQTVRWRCGSNHEWEAVVKNRTKGKGCPYCSGRLAIPGVNDLATVAPDLAALLVDQSLATKLTKGSSRKVVWRCPKEGHTFASNVPHTPNGSKWCPICSGKLTLPGFNDLATVAPDLAAQLVDKSLGTKLTGGSSKRVRWRCELGHEWETTPAHRSKGQACPVCAGRRVELGFNDLATVAPELAAQLVDQSLATRLTRGSGKSVAWRCERGHEWETRVPDRLRGQDCPVCSGNQTLPGFNDLATVAPELAAQLVDQSLANEVSKGSNRKVRWRCELGHEWETTPAHRVANRGCPECVVGSFSPVAPGVLYLLATPGGRVYKFGIANDAEQRLANHARQGFSVVVEVHQFDTGEEARAAERRVIEHARAAGWRQAMTAEQMPYGGASETLLADDVGDDFTLAPFLNL